ncbi:MAG: hypothetical protein P1Q69_17140 [Candidatus Thorarchaeota archaeon]|nr:hypothetical protein [Candidatus Thorarchaeota archaeon]
MLLEESNRTKDHADLLLDLLFHDIRGHLSSLQIALELMEIHWENRIEDNASEGTIANIALRIAEDVQKGNGELVRDIDRTLIPNVRV